MAKTSKSQIKAKNNYEKANPEQAFYWQKKSSAKGFIDPRPTTKLYKLVQNDINFKSTYIDDLKEFKAIIDNTINKIKGQLINHPFIF